MPFIEDFKKLQLAMPRIALQFSQSENSEYTNYASWHNHDLEYCELVFNSHHCFGCI